MGYTLKLDLTGYQHSVLVELLTEARQRAERDGTQDSRHAQAVAEIGDQIDGYAQAVELARQITAEEAR